MSKPRNAFARQGPVAFTPGAGARPPGGSPSAVTEVRVLGRTRAPRRRAR